MTKQYPVASLLALYDPDAIGIRTLATYAKANAGISMNQIFFKNLFPSRYPYTETELRLLIALVKDLKTELLGISLRSSSFGAARSIISRIKDDLKDVRIAIGGTHAIVAPEECIELADFVFIGEGEQPFLDLIVKYHDGFDGIRGIPGLWIKHDNQVHKNGINELIDVDELPVIDYSDENKWFIEEDAVKEGDPLAGNSVGEIFASRGCPYHCTYCSNDILKNIMHEGKFVRVKKVDKVIEDIVNLKKYFRNLKKIVFADEVFALGGKWTVEFCEKYKSKINLPFAALFNPNSVKEENVRALKDAGLTHARMGVQSGSETVRKGLYKRMESNERIIEAVKLFHKYEIRTTLDTIVNNPYETEADLRDSLDFYLQIPKPYELNLHSLVYFPKTELTLKALADGVIKPEHVEGPVDEALRLNHVLLKNKEMIYGYENNLFWNCLFSLSSKPFVPAGFIRFLAGSAILRKRPVLLLYLSKMINTANIALIGMNLLKRREIGLKEVFDAARKFAFTSSVSK